MTALAALCWGGQAIVCFAPAAGVQLGLSEAEAEVEPAFWADVRGEALWDFFTLWTLVVAGALLITGSRAWAYFGLVGGGMYVYFAGRGILTRVAMLRRGLRIGTFKDVRRLISSDKFSFEFCKHFWKCSFIFTITCFINECLLGKNINAH